MGSGKTSSVAFASFSTSRGYDDPGTTVNDIYRSRTIDESLDPKKFDIRESVDGDDNPESTPIIVALDVTGSMAPVLKEVGSWFKTLWRPTVRWFYLVVVIIVLLISLLIK